MHKQEVNTAKSQDFYRSLLVSVILLLIVPTVINLIVRGDYVPISVATLFTILEIPRHVYTLYSLSYEQPITNSLMSGGISGIILALAGRAGIAISRLVWASGTSETMLGVFINSWWLYLAMGLFGMFCMLVKLTLKTVKARRSNMV